MRRLSLPLYSYSITLSILVCIQSVFSSSPQFTVQPSDAPIAYSQTATLACQAIGNPSPTITWWRGSLLVALGVKYSQLSDNSLQITDFSSINEGEYACIAENNDGNVRSRNASITLAFLQSPTITSPVTVCITQYMYQELPCDVPNSNPEPTVTWYRGSTQAQYSNRIGMSLSHKLVFSYMMPTNDAAQWRCRVSNGTKTYDSSSYVLSEALCPGGSLPTLSPTQTVQLQINPQTQTVHAGGTAQLDCFASGRPLPTYSWEKDGVTLVSSNRISFSQDGKILRIQEVTSSDAGSYTCIATQSLANQMNPFTTTGVALLTVIDPPTIIDSFGATTQNASLSVSLTCQATGTSPIKWAWRRNTEILIPSDRISITSSSAITTLTITGLMVNEGGVFQCVASNSAGTAASNELLTVSTSPPVITVPPSDSLVLVNTTLSLPCRGTGFPIPTVRWRKSNIDLIPDATHVIASDGTLTVSLVEMSDAGSYRCVLSNEIGTIVSSVAIVKVINPPTTVIVPTDSIVTIGETITMLCLATGDNIVLIGYRWNKDGSPVDTSDPRITVASNLTITNFMEADRGKYECIAELTILGITAQPVLYSIGSAFYTEMTPMPPGAPQSLMVQTSTHNRVSLSWSTPSISGGLNILEYIVNIITIGRPDCEFSGEMNVTVSAPSTLAEVSPLAPYSQHRVQVFARNSKGISLSSNTNNPLLFWTEQAAPQAAPGVISAVQGSRIGELNISWQTVSCEFTNGEITQYAIQYRPQDSSFPPSVAFSSSLSITITGLQVLTMYEIAVAAETSVGRGVFSSSIVATTTKASAPLQPRSLTGLPNVTTITLTWLSPLPVPGEPLTNQTSVSGYTVTTEDGQSTFLSETSFIVTNLSVGIEYTFRVAAHNAFGMGEPAVINITIPTEAPPTVIMFYDEPWFIPAVAGGGAAIVFAVLLVSILICCLCCRRRWHSADIKSLGRSSATYGRPASYLASALQVEVHSSSSSDGSTTSGSRTPTPLYHEPADTLGNTSDPVRVTGRGTIPRNDTLKSNYMYRSPMERAEDDLNRMVETQETANRGTGRIIMPLAIELEMRTRSTTDTLPPVPKEGLDSPDYQWSPPAGRPLPYALQNGGSNHLQYRDEDNRTRHSSSSSHHNNDSALRNERNHHGRDHHSIHRDQNHQAFRQTGRDVTRHHSDVARHHHDVQRRNNDVVHHHSDVKPRHSNDPINSVVSDMPRPNSPPHDQLSSHLKTDYPMSSPTRAPPFKPPPPARRSNRPGSPTASVTSFEYQCLSPFKMNKKSRHKHQDQHTQPQHDRQSLPRHQTTSAQPRDSNSAQLTIPSDSSVGAPRKLNYTPALRQYTVPSRRRQNLPDITQAMPIEEEFDHLADEQPRAHANIHRRPTKLAEEEEKRITMEKIQQRRKVKHAASAARHPSMYDDGDATLV